MGLDTVELVMVIEDEFEVAIPDAVAAELTTPGQVAEYLVNVLGERGGRDGRVRHGTLVLPAAS